MSTAASAVPVQGAPADRCPGALTMHLAQDGLLARVRLPGGRISGRTLLGLVQLAEDCASGVLELTSRANVQLRGIRPVAGDVVASGVAALGLLPSPTHELVRNMLASPLAGLDAAADVDDLLGALDRQLCAVPGLARLSGRFLFGIDDGRGDVATLRPDAWAARVGPDRWWVWPTSVDVATEEVVGELLAVAQVFLATADGAWRVADLPEGGAAVLSRRLRRGRLARPGPPLSAGDRPAGVVPQLDGRSAVVAQVPLGQLSAVAARALGPGTLRITPWRSIVVPDVVDAEPVVADLTRAGLSVGFSLWTLVTACAGRPGCAQALADVRTDATAAVRTGRTTPGGLSTRPVHWSGCERRCGSPAGPHVDVVAGPAGYDVRTVA